MKKLRGTKKFEAWKEEIVFHFIPIKINYLTCLRLTLVNAYTIFVLFNSRAYKKIVGKKKFYSIFRSLEVLGDFNLI